MIRLGRMSVIGDLTMQQNVPRAGQHAKEYMAVLWDAIRECEPEGVLSIDSAKGGGVEFEQCIVLTPTHKRLSYYQQLHFAVPTGSQLHMGFYVIGGERAAAGSGFGGETFGIGLPTDADVQNVVSMAEMIRDYAVAPAIQHIVDMVQGGGENRHGGFAGV